jgi:hypothetical protein
MCGTLLQCRLSNLWCGYTRLARRRCPAPADAAEPLLAAHSQLFPLSAQRQQLRVQPGQLQAEARQGMQGAMAMFRGGR